jgi:hypothetical protein
MALNFDDARLLDGLCYDLKLGDFPRGKNRALLNDLYNGVPPYSEKEVEENKIDVNVNFLEGTRLLHDARAQYYQAFMKPGVFFTLNTDFGPQHDRSDVSAKVTRHMNRVMKRSLKYFEVMRSKFGMLVLHGISPAVWEDQEKWCPKSIGVEDALVPSNTLVGFDNLPFFVAYRSFTGFELAKLTAARHRDPGWNMRTVNKAIKWVDSQATALMGSNWPEIWAPEKMSERIKGDGGFYATDQLPTIDCFDIYGYDDRGKESGWVRRIILDSWSTPQAYGGGYQMERNSKLGGLTKITKDDFLYTSKDRRIADTMQSIISFQFADLSSVAPFRYHSVRSLGFLLYAVCHLQNRLRGQFNYAVFESLMQYFRVKTMEDVQRALKIELVHKGFLDENISPVPQSERWTVNSQLVELGLSENKNLISEQSSGSVQNSNFSRDRVEKTRFQVMAEVNASTSMLSSGLMQAYHYQAFEYREIVRRFMRPHSLDPDVREFRQRCLQDGVPEKMLNVALWDVAPERVMGAGNKTLEMAQTEQLMNFRPLFDPDAQRKILRDMVLNVTDDPARATDLVPEQPVVSNSVHDAQLAAGTLMQGLPVSIKSGINRAEYCQALIADMAIIVTKIQKTGGMGTPDQLQGVQNIAQHVGQNLQILAGDDQSKELVRQMQQQLSQIMNLVKGFAKNLQTAMAKRNGQQGGGMDQKDVAKIQATTAMTQAKIELAKQSHASKTAQRQLQFEHQMKQDQERNALEIQTQAAKARLDIAAQRMKTFNEGDDSA